MGRGETLAIRSYTVVDGLAHDHVSHIYRDSHDFLWICTDDGLSRFDGRHFVNYTTADGLPHIHVNDIIEASSGDYWLATDGGVTLFRPAHPAQRFKSFKPDGPPQALFINAIVEEPQGALLVGSAAGLYRLRREENAARFEPINFGAPAGMREASSINAICREPSGTLWIGTASGLYRRDPSGVCTRFTTSDGLPHDFVDHLVTDPDSRIWACTRHGLARLARTPRPGVAIDLTVTSANGLPHPDVRTIRFMPDGRRWIGTLGGLVEWAPGPPGPANFRVYTEDDGLNDREVYALSSDPAGNIWIGSRRGGLIRLAQSGFQTFGKKDGLSLSGSDELLETSAGGICVAALADARRVISCLNARRFAVTIPRLPDAATAAIPSSNQSMIVDHFGDWWISSPRGLFRLRGAKSRPGAAVGGADLTLLPEVESRRMLEDGRHNVWVTTYKAWSFGLERWDRGSSQVRDFSASLPLAVRERGIAALAEAPEGQLWIGLNRPGGLYRLRKGRFEEIASVPPGNIQALYRDAANRLWMASAEAGLGRVDNPDAERITVRRYDYARGLSSNEVWCLTEDHYGRIYAGTARGVDQIDPMLDRITHYSSADGLTQGDIRAALSDRNGDLWFLSKQGLSRLRPTANVRQQPLQARITAIRIAGTQHPISDLGDLNVQSVESPWNRNSAQIDFSAVAFQAPEQLRYQFRLLGAAGDWSDPSPDSTVHFSNLAPGRYRFLVRAINADGIAGPEPASFGFTISAPPWRRWWFLAGIAVAVTGLAYLGHRLRLERQLALERVRSRIATDLHDDIGASLSRIAVMSEVIKSCAGVADDESQRMLTEIAESSRALVDGMSDIVWSIDPRRDNLGDVVARLRAFGSDVLEPRGIAWTCEGPSAALHQHLSPDQRRQLYLIFKEAIHNIARHSHARNVTLRITVEGGEVQGEIHDDGCGVPSNGGEGLGMVSMRGRSVRLGGEFRINAGPEGGTRATLNFPLASRKT